MQLVTQDLALVGNSILMTPVGAIDPTVGFPGCFPFGTSPNEFESCLALTDVSPTVSTLALRYVSSQFPVADACRDVGYRIAGGALQRSDVACGTTPVWVDLAPDVVGFKTLVVCSDGVRYGAFPNVGCGGGVSYARSALVSVAASSTGTANATAQQLSLVGIDPASPTTVACPTARTCFDGTQEVLMPNLKDQ